MEPPVIIRRSGAILALKVILLELVLEALSLTVHTIARYALQTLGETSYQVSNSHALSVIIVSSQLIILVFQVWTMAYLFLRWSHEYFELRKKEVIIKVGIFRKQQSAYPYNNMQAIVVRQSILERLLNAGAVTVYIPTLGRDIKFSEISNPTQFADDLKKAIPYSEGGQFILRK